MRTMTEMAREIYGEHMFWTDDQLLKRNAFAELVATEATEEANRRANASWSLMCEKMVAAEKEACAKVADYYSMHDQDTPSDIAAAIRARSNA